MCMGKGERDKREQKNSKREIGRQTDRNRHTNKEREREKRRKIELKRERDEGGGEVEKVRDRKK